MGNDGGTTATRRDCLTKKKKQPKKLNIQNTALINWTTCRLSNEKFSPTEPIVACKLGFLMRKEALIQILIDKTKKKQLLTNSLTFNHIHSLKDVADVKFTVNPEYNPNSGDTPAKKSLFICPISQKPITGTHKFYFFRTCGHVISKEAMENIKSSKNEKNSDNSESEKKCLVCGTNNPLITELNPQSEDLAKIKQALLEKGEISLEAPNNNKKKRKLEQESATASSENADIVKAEKTEDSEPTPKKRKLDQNGQINLAETENEKDPTKIANKKHEMRKEQSEVYRSLFN